MGGQGRDDRWLQVVLLCAGNKKQKPAEGGRVVR